MPSGQYTLDDDKGKGHADTSFRACVIVLLVFLLFCVTIIIILYVVKKDGVPGSSVKDEHGGTSSKHVEDEAEKPKSFQPLQENPTTSVSPTHGGHAAEGSKHRSSSETNNTTTEYPTSTTARIHESFADERRASEGEVKTSANLTSTSTEHPTKTSTENSDPIGLDTSHDKNETKVPLTSTTTEILPTTASTEERRSSEDEVKLTTNLTSTSTEHPTETSTGTSVLTGLVTSDDKNETKVPLTSTTTEILPTTASTEERRSPEGSAESTGNVTSTSSDPTSTSEPPTTPPAPPLPPLSEDPVACETAKCKKLAANMLIMMGHDADPCKQFYEFACGGLRENKYLLQPVYEDEAWQRISNEVNKLSETDPESYRKFKTLEESCNNFDPVKNINMWKEAVQNEMMDLGEITFVGRENITHLFLGLLQHDRPFIFEVTLDINDIEPTRFAIKIFPAQMMKTRLYPEDNGASECQIQAAQKYKNLTLIYIESVKCMNKHIGRTKTMNIAKKALLTLGIFSAPDDEEKLNNTLADYSEFLDLSTPVSDERRTWSRDLAERQPDQKTIKELDSIFGGLNIKWSTIIENLIGRPMKEDEHVQLYSTVYFREINERFGSRQRQLHNGLLVSFAVARYNDLVVAQERWRRVVHPLHCTRLAAHLLPDVASALYLRSFSLKHRKELEMQGSDFVFDIENTFFKELDRASWLAEDTYKALKESLEYKFVHVKMGNATDNPELMDADILDVALRNYTINETQFIGNAIKLMARNRQRLYRRIDEMPIDHLWSHFVAPYDIAGISLHSLNVFAIPFGAVEEPFFSAEYLPHIKMAGYGFEVAHEMAHHIDSIGINFNTTSIKKTNKEYTNSIIPRFSEFIHNVNIEYLNLTGPAKHQDVPFEFLDNDYALKNNEYFADKIGITLAYKTYKRTQKRNAKLMLPYLSLTNDQTFFIFLAQKYCTKVDYFDLVLDFYESSDFPPETRIKNMMNDNTDFYEAFNCSVAEKTDRPFPYSIYTSAEDASEGRLL